MIELIAEVQENSQRLRAINERIAAMNADWKEIIRKMAGLKQLRYPPPNIHEMVVLSDRICERASEVVSLMERMQSLSHSFRFAESFSLLPRIEELVGINENLHRQALVNVRSTWDSCIARN